MQQQFLAEHGAKTVPGVHVCDVDSNPATIATLLDTLGNKKSDDGSACVPQLSTSCGVPVLRSIPYVKQWFGPSGCVTADELEAKVDAIVGQQ